MLQALLLRRCPKSPLPRHWAGSAAEHSAPGVHHLKKHGRGLRKLGRLLALLILPWHAARAQQALDVLDWKAATTLNTYLLQEVHRQYAPRRAELAEANTSAAAMRTYQDSLRRRFRRVLGPLPTRTPLAAQVLGLISQPGFRIEKIVYESSPRHHVTANLYVPAEAGPRPAVLLLCGHEAAAKATVSYQKTAMLLATHGFVVLVVDPVSQGERMQLTDPAGRSLTRGGTTEHTLLNAGAALVGRSLPAEQLWDNVRGLDYLSSRPEVDTARLGCVGNSGGATQTAYLMAFDRRVKAAVLCSYVASGERNLELTGPADGCVQLPGAGRWRLEPADWPIMFAPRPLLLLAGRYDFVDYRNIEQVHTELSRANTALVGAPTNALFTNDDGHGIGQAKREQAVQWFRRRLGTKADTATVHEGALPTLSESALRCTRSGQVNTEYPGEQTLADRHRAQAQALAAQRPRRSPAALAAVVRQQLSLTGADANQTVAIERRDSVRVQGLVWQKLILRRGNEPPLPALLLLPKGEEEPRKLIIWLLDEGKSGLLDSVALLRNYQSQRAAVLVADLRGLGETADPAAFNDPKYYNREYRPALLGLHLGRPLLAQRVADVNTLLRLRRANPHLRGLPVEMHANGHVAPVALHAALLYAEIHRLVLPQAPLSYAELLARPATQDQYSDVLPGVLRYYDLPDLQRALGRRLVIPAK